MVESNAKDTSFEQKDPVVNKRRNSLQESLKSGISYGEQVVEGVLGSVKNYAAEVCVNMSDDSNQNTFHRDPEEKSFDATIDGVQRIEVDKTYNNEDQQKQQQEQ
jgi:hypothetical protein